MSIFDLPEDEFLSIFTPIVESMLVGFNEDNYEQFSEYFSDGMKECVDIENYSKQRKEIFPDLGEYKKIELLATHKNPDEIIVMWRLYCSNREAPALTTYFFGEQRGKVEIEGATIHY